MLNNNGGYRPEFDIKVSGDRFFKSSLRTYSKSPNRSITSPVSELANFDSYQRWQSNLGKYINKKHARMQKDLIMRLSRGSPERETTINYIISTNDRSGTVIKKSISSYQGAREPYYSSSSKMKDSRNKRASGNSVLLTTGHLLEAKRQ